MHSLCKHPEAGIKGMLPVPRSYQAQNHHHTGQERGTEGCPSMARAWTHLLGFLGGLNRTEPVQVSAQQLAHGKVSATMIITIAVINPNT